MTSTIASTQQRRASATLRDLRTPCLLLDVKRMNRNIDRLKRRLEDLGVSLRPHLKTCKSIEIARLLMESAEGPATVSTLKEAEEFAAAGVRDILYAVGIAPNKLRRVVELRRAGVDLTVILDSIEQARAVVAAGQEAGEGIPVLIEVDPDGCRAGVKPGEALLVEIGRVLHAGGAELRGVLAHSGGSYHDTSIEAHVRAAETERALAGRCAADLRKAGLPCPVVSVGSTPAAHFANTLTGVTEVRAGVFVFMDLMNAGLNVCALDDIAISVLATVIGHRRDRGWIIVDAGWMAMSADRGTSEQPVDQGYGVVCEVDGRVYQDLVMASANQEHGILAIRDGSSAKLPDLPVGAQVRILPIHACATAAQFDRYHLVDDQGAVTDVWGRFSGW